MRTAEQVCNALVDERRVEVPVFAWGSRPWLRISGHAVYNRPEDYERLAAVLLEALEAIRTAVGETPTPAEVLDALRARPGWEWLKSPRRLAGLLNPLGVARRQFWNGGRRRWCYVLDAGQLADLQTRYGAGGEGPEEGPGTDPGAPLSAPETGAIR